MGLPNFIEDLQLMVSSFCPGQCQNCSLWKTPKKEAIKDELSLNLLEKALHSKSLAKVSYVDLTAGESQISPRYLPIIKMLSQTLPQASIHTNISGWYPKKHLEITQAALNFFPPEKIHIDISLDGRKENYEKVRFVSRGFEKVMQTTELLRKLPIRLRYVMVLYPETFKDIPYVVELAEKNSMGYYFGYPRISNHNFKNSASTYLFTPQQINWIESTLEGLDYLTPRRKPQWLWAKSVYEKKIPFFECLMGQKALVIDPYGNTFPCNELSPLLNMGSLKKFGGDMDSLLKSENPKKVITQVKGKKMPALRYALRSKSYFSLGPAKWIANHRSKLNGLSCAIVKLKENVPCHQIGDRFGYFHGFRRMLLRWWPFSL